jgi:hypothetical protein
VAKFLSDVIDRFGRPIAPVRVRVPQTKPNLHFVDNGEASTIPHIRAEEPPDNAGTTREEKYHEESSNPTN